MAGTPAAHCCTVDLVRLLCVCSPACFSLFVQRFCGDVPTFFPVWEVLRSSWEPAAAAAGMCVRPRSWTHCMGLLWHIISFERVNGEEVPG
jgi:hypothetical protein